MSSPSAQERSDISSFESSYDSFDGRDSVLGGRTYLPITASSPGKFRDTLTEDLESERMQHN